MSDGLNDQGKVLDGSYRWPDALPETAYKVGVDIGAPEGNKTVIDVTPCSVEDNEPHPVEEATEPEWLQGIRTRVQAMETHGYFIEYCKPGAILKDKVGMKLKRFEEKKTSRGPRNVAHLIKTFWTPVSSDVHTQMEDLVSQAEAWFRENVKDAEPNLES